jgi:hypothetical protein
VGTVRTTAPHKTRLVWLVSGVVIGVLLGYVVTHMIGPPLGCGRGEVRILTEDLTLGSNEYVRQVPPPVAGIIRRGSEFQVKARLGGRVYVSFEALVPSEAVEVASGAHDSGASETRRLPSPAKSQPEQK